MISKTPHIDPTHPAVAAILAFDLDAYAERDDVYTATAAALRPIVVATPLLRKPDEDNEWSPAEGAVAAANLIVECAATATRHGKWQLCQDQIDRLRKCQRHYACTVIRDRLGVFPGFYVSVQCRWSTTPDIRVFPAGVSADLTPPLFHLPSDVTRREVELAIAVWQAGHNLGQREGAERIRRGIRDLIEVEAA